MLLPDEKSAVDPRVRRTRQMLYVALEGLLATREFAELSVQDITEAAAVNRATFYDHYPDKFALLESMVAERFHGLLRRRGVSFDGTCGQAVRAIILGACDFLAGHAASPCGGKRRLEPHLELAIVAIVRRMLLDGFRQHPGEGGLSPELRASAAAWAIYGGAKEWTQLPDRGDSAQGASLVWQLASPLFGFPSPPSSARGTTSPG